LLHRKSINRINFDRSLIDESHFLINALRGGIDKHRKGFIPLDNSDGVGNLQSFVIGSEANISFLEAIRSDKGVDFG